eukprot:2423427-Lingulodinium_polyedra.AAC.1
MISALAFAESGTNTSWFFSYLRVIGLQDCWRAAGSNLSRKDTSFSASGRETPLSRASPRSQKFRMRMK